MSSIRLNAQPLALNSTPAPKTTAANAGTTEAAGGFASMMKRLADPAQPASASASTSGSGPDGEQARPKHHKLGGWPSSTSDRNGGANAAGDAAPASPPAAALPSIVPQAPQAALLLVDVTAWARAASPLESPVQSASSTVAAAGSASAAPSPLTSFIVPGAPIAIADNAAGPSGRSEPGVSSPLSPLVPAPLLDQASSRAASSTGAGGAPPALAGASEPATIAPTPPATSAANPAVEPGTAGPGPQPPSGSNQPVSANGTAADPASLAVTLDRVSAQGLTSPDSPPTDPAGTAGGDPHAPSRSNQAAPPKGIATAAPGQPATEARGQAGPGIDPASLAAKSDGVSTQRHGSAAPSKRDPGTIDGARVPASPVSGAPTLRQPDTAPVPPTPAHQIVTALQVLARDGATTSVGSSDAGAAAPAAASPPATAASATSKAITIQLNPENLGAVSVSMRMRGGTIDIRIEVANSDTLHLLQKDRHILSAAVEAAGSNRDALLLTGPNSSPAADVGRQNAIWSPGFSGGQGQHDGGRPAPSPTQATREDDNASASTDRANRPDDGLYL